MAINVKRFTFTPSPLTVEEANFRHLIMDIAWFGIGLAATSRFASVFAIRLGADASDISLITSIPALILLVGSALGGWWTRRFSNPVKALFWPTFLFRFAFLLPAFAPIMPQELRVWWIILALTIPAIPQGVSSVVFTVMMRDAIPLNRMQPLLGFRSIAMNVSLAISALLLGVWLEWAPFPMNYQIMYVVAFAFQLLSVRECMAVRVENPSRQEKPASFIDSLVKPWRSPDFRKIALVAALLHIALLAVNAIIPLHLVQSLNASEGFVALYSIVELGSAALISLFAARISARIGTRNMIALGILLTSIAMLVLAIAPSLTFTLLGAALTGFGWTLSAMIGMFAYMMERVPSEKMSEYSPVYHQVIGLSMFVAPFIGSVLASSNMNLATVLLIGALLRFSVTPIIAFGGRVQRMVMAPNPT